MYVKSSSNCCINVWDENLEIKFDLYVIFPEYVDNEPMTDGTEKLLENGYQNLKDIETIKEAENYLKKCVR